MGAILEVKETENPYKGGEVDSCGLYLIRFLIISLINIADLIISIIFFDPNYMAFFVLKFITIFSIFFLYLCLCYGYSYIYSDDSLSGLFPLFLLFISSLIALVLEITLLVLFIKNYSDLNSIVQIFYYIHWVPIIIIYILYFKIKK